MSKYKEIDPDRVATSQPARIKRPSSNDGTKTSEQSKSGGGKENSKRLNRDGGKKNSNQLKSDDGKQNLTKDDEEKKNSLIKEINFLIHLCPYLEQAGYGEIPQKDVRDLLCTYYRYGDVELQVHMDDFDFLRIWVFGKSGKPEHKVSLKEMTEKQWKKFISPDTYEPASGLCHRRVVVAARSKNAHNMIFKCFKDVPVGHFEVLIPQAKIQIPWKQKWFWNTFLVSSGLVLFCNVGLWLQSEHKMDTHVIVAGVILFVIVRTKKLYDNVRNRYRILWKQMLYYKSTSNNSALALEILNRANAQKFKHTLLAYVAALTVANTNRAKGATSDQIVGQCNLWFDRVKHSRPEREIGCIDFSVGIVELLNIGILTKTDSEEAYELEDVATALNEVKRQLLSLCNRI